MFGSPLEVRIGMNTGGWWPATRASGSPSLPATRSTSPPGSNRPRRQATSCWASPPTSSSATRSGRARSSRCRGQGQVESPSPPTGCSRCDSLAARSRAAARRVRWSVAPRSLPCYVRARCRRDSGCRLVTVIGEAGVGQVPVSCATLVRSAPGGARRSRDAASPYGEGITYWPAGRDPPRGGRDPRRDVRWARAAHALAEARTGRRRSRPSC